MKHEDQNATIIMLTLCLVISMCANIYAYFILPEKQWEEAQALTWTEIDSSYFSSGQTTVSVTHEESLAEEILPTEAPETSRAPVATQKPSNPSIQYAGATVYVTKSGTKFHRNGCSSLSKSKIPMLFEEAMAQGYDPCGKCKP